MAQSVRLHAAPPFGSLVRVPYDDHELYAIVAETRTASLEAGGRPIARGYGVGRGRRDLPRESGPGARPAHGVSRPAGGVLRRGQAATAPPARAATAALLGVCLRRGRDPDLHRAAGVPADAARGAGGGSRRAGSRECSAGRRGARPGGGGGVPAPRRPRASRPATRRLRPADRRVRRLHPEEARR